MEQLSRLIRWKHPWLQSAPFRGRFLGRSLYELNRKHPKLEYNATLIIFVVAILTFSDQSLRRPFQEESKVIKILVELGLPVDISYP